MYEFLRLNGLGLRIYHVCRCACGSIVVTVNRLSVCLSVHLRARIDVVAFRSELGAKERYERADSCKTVSKEQIAITEFIACYPAVDTGNKSSQDL